MELPEKSSDADGLETKFLSANWTAVFLVFVLPFLPTPMTSISHPTDGRSSSFYTLRCKKIQCTQFVFVLRPCCYRRICGQVCLQAKLAVFWVYFFIFIFFIWRPNVWTWALSWVIVFNEQISQNDGWKRQVALMTGHYECSGMRKLTPKQRKVLEHSTKDTDRLNRGRKLEKDNHFLISFCCCLHRSQVINSIQNSDSVGNSQFWLELFRKNGRMSVQTNNLKRTEYLAWCMKEVQTKLELNCLWQKFLPGWWRKFWSGCDPKGGLW